MPNLLMADNDLKLIAIYKNTGNDNKVAERKSDGLYYLAESLKTVKTEWAYQVEKDFEAEPKK